MSTHCTKKKGGRGAIQGYELFWVLRRREKGGEGARRTSNWWGGALGVL